MIEVKPEKVSSPILIRLEQQGGEVEMTLFDEATHSIVYAGLSLHREPSANKIFGGSRSFSIGDDGSSSSILLPPGDYA
jgi:hypothetical protein